MGLMHLPQSLEEEACHQPRREPAQTLQACLEQAEDLQHLSALVHSSHQLPKLMLDGASFLPKSPDMGLLLPTWLSDGAKVLPKPVDAAHQHESYCQWLLLLMLTYPHTLVPTGLQLVAAGLVAGCVLRQWTQQQLDVVGAAGHGPKARECAG